MSSSNEPKGIKRKLSDDDDESKATDKSGTASSSSSHVHPIKQEQFDESESKPTIQSSTVSTFARPVKLENVQVKQEETAGPVFGHMAKCTLGNQCTTPHCSTLKSIANHLFDCTCGDCLFCTAFQPQSNIELPQVSSESQSTLTKDLKQLLSTLRNNNSPEAQKQVSNVLKSQPTLVDTFLKQRKEQKQKQHVPQNLFAKLSE